MNFIQTFKSLSTKCVLVVVLFLSANTVFAGWSGIYPVYEVMAHDEGYVFIRLNPLSAHPNPAECVSSSYLRIEKDHINKELFYQMGLTAHASGLKLQVYVHDTECSGNYPMVKTTRTRK